jgi:hypothetical protein
MIPCVNAAYRNDRSWLRVLKEWGQECVIGSGSGMRYCVIGLIPFRGDDKLLPG